MAEHPFVTAFVKATTDPTLLTIILDRMIELVSTILTFVAAIYGGRWIHQRRKDK